jgi:hypothetical protein
VQHESIKSHPFVSRVSQGQFEEKNTLKNYEFLFTRFSDEFGDRELESITPDEILSFLTCLTEGNKQTTKRNRYSCLKAFFNYIRNTIDFEIQNPCDAPILRKIFSASRPEQWKIIEKDSHDLRRHAATYASRSGTPIEIVSKVILRHAHLSTTQRYLGKVTDVEAIRWIENLYA